MHLFVAFPSGRLAAPIERVGRGSAPTPTSCSLPVSGRSSSADPDDPFWWPGPATCCSSTIDLRLADAFELWADVAARGPVRGRPSSCLARRWRSRERATRRALAPVLWSGALVLLLGAALLTHVRAATRRRARSCCRPSLGAAAGDRADRLPRRASCARGCSAPAWRISSWSSARSLRPDAGPRRDRAHARRPVARARLLAARGRTLRRPGRDRVRPGGRIPDARSPCSSTTGHASRPSSTTRRCSTTPSSSRRSAPPPASRSRTRACRRSCAPSSRRCAPRAPGSSRRVTPSAGGSSATSTTARSSACSGSGSRSSSPAAGSPTERRSTSCSPRRTPRSSARSRSCARSRAASTRRSSPTKDSPRLSPRSRGAPRSRSS